MCVNKKWVTNPYTHRAIYVSCGHCPACQQEKANKRAMRIRNQQKDGYLQFFCTFTYQNKYIPYVLKTDLDANFNKIHIYRDFDVRRVRTSSDYKMAYRDYVVSEAIDCIDLVDEDYKNYKSSDYNHLQNGNPNHIGVIYYKDIQNYFKRLRSNLIRRYNYDVSKISFFSCAEIGPKTKRPHFHALISVPAADAELLRKPISEAWPFNGRVTERRKVEIAKNAASYVASYVNCSNTIPSLFRTDNLRQRHSYSKTYGLGQIGFSLHEVMEKVRNRNVTYPVPVAGEQFKFTDIPLPVYVVNRYFPKFKGYFRLAYNSLFDVLTNPKRISAFSRLLSLSLSDLHFIRVRLTHARDRFCKYFGTHPVAFAHAWLDTWQQLEAVRLRQFYENKGGELWCFKYDNVGCAVDRLIPSPWDEKMFLPLYNLYNYHDANSFPYNLIKNNNLEDLYYKKDKSKKVTNLVMLENGCEV